MFIYIVRHAWAFEHGDPRWPDDSQRPLEEEGAVRFVRVVQQLVPRGFEPHAIVTSPYVRCRQTADLIAAHTPHSPQVMEHTALRPGSDLEELCAWTRDFSEGKSVAWVGHAPDVGWLASGLVGDGAAIRFSKGAVAAIRVRDKIGPDCGELHWLATAKVLGV
jgi:phosphohistidine phosphatase